MVAEAELSGNSDYRQTIESERKLEVENGLISDMRERREEKRRMKRMELCGKMRGE